MLQHELNRIPWGTAMCLTFVQSPKEMKTCQRESSNCPKGNHGLTEEDRPAVTHSKDGSKGEESNGLQEPKEKPHSGGEHSWKASWRPSCLSEHLPLILAKGTLEAEQDLAE